MMRNCREISAGGERPVRYIYSPISSKIVEELTKEYMLRDARQSKMLEEAASEAFRHDQAKEQALRERAEAVQALELAIQSKLEVDNHLATCEKQLAEEKTENINLKKSFKELSEENKRLSASLTAAVDDKNRIRQIAISATNLPAQIEKANAKITSLEAQLQTAAMSKLNVEVECRQAQDKMRQMETLLEQMRQAREKYEKSTELEDKYTALLEAEKQAVLAKQQEVEQAKTETEETRAELVVRVEALQQIIDQFDTERRAWKNDMSTKETELFETKSQLDHEKIKGSGKDMTINALQAQLSEMQNARISAIGDVNELVASADREMRLRMDIQVLEKQIKATQEVHAAEAAQVLKNQESSRREVEMFKNLADDATLAAAQMRTELDKANAQLQKATDKAQALRVSSGDILKDHDTVPTEMLGRKTESDAQECGIASQIEELQQMCDSLKAEKADLIKALKLARSESSKLSYALDLAEKSIENKLQEWQDTKKENERLRVENAEMKVEAHVITTKTKEAQDAKANAHLLEEKWNAKALTFEEQIIVLRGERDEARAELKEMSALAERYETAMEEGKQLELMRTEKITKETTERLMKAKEKEMEALRREHECAIASTQDQADRQFWSTQQQLRESNAQVRKLEDERDKYYRQAQGKSEQMANMQEELKKVYMLCENLRHENDTFRTAGFLASESEEGKLSPEREASVAKAEMEQLQKRAKWLIAANEHAEAELANERWRYKELESRAAETLQYAEELQRQHNLEKHELSNSVREREVQIAQLNNQITKLKKELQYQSEKVDEMGRRTAEESMATKEETVALAKGNKNMLSELDRLKYANNEFEEKTAQLSQEVETLKKDNLELREAIQNERKDVERRFEDKIAKMRLEKEDTVKQCNWLTAERDRIEAVKDSALITNAQQQERVQAAYKEIELLKTSLREQLEKPTDKQQTEMEAFKIEIEQLKQQLASAKDKEEREAQRIKEMQASILLQSTRTPELEYEVHRMKEQFGQKNKELDHMTGTMNQLKTQLEENVQAKARSLQECAKLRAQVDELRKEADQCRLGYKNAQALNKEYQTKLMNAANKGVFL